MTESLKKYLERRSVSASAPCRVDMGGTLDISTFFNVFRYLDPCTFNIAVDLRTRVTLLPYRAGWVKVSSRGFPDAEFLMDQAPFNHPLGLMFAVAAYFRAGGVHIVVESTSPPRSALGGSSVAAVALVAAFAKARERSGGDALSRKNIALLALSLEAGVAGVPCGFQDQLAAVFGGVNAWYWTGAVNKSVYRRRVVVPKSSHKRLARHLLVAYCGVPHISKDVNGTWVRQFLSGTNRNLWEEVVRSTRQFVDALKQLDFAGAAGAMNRETAIRRRMTPEVLDSMGAALFDAAVQTRCGARFTGAGGGGCLWAVGEAENLEILKSRWRDILAMRENAGLMDLNIDSDGLMVDDKRLINGKDLNN